MRISRAALVGVLVLSTYIALEGQVRVNGVQNPSYGEVTATCLETGQGCNDLYDMDQNLLTTSVFTNLGQISNSNILVNKDAIGSTTTNGLALVNNTAAAAGAQQWSPRLLLSGNGWKTNATAASQAVQWRAEVIPVQGAAAPTGSVVFTPIINGSDGTPVSFNSTGSIVLTNTLSTAHIVSSGLQSYGAAVTATVDGATTFAMTSTFMNLACTGAETIDTITGGSAGVILILSHQDTDCTFNDDASPTAANALALTGAATDVGAVQKFIGFVHDGNAWQELWESDN